MSKGFQVFQQPGGLSLGAAILWMGLQSGITVPLIAILVSEFGGLDKTQVTVFFTFGVAAGIAVPLLAGHLSDGRFRRSMLALFFGTAGAVGSFSLTMTTSPWALYLLQILSSGGMVLFSLFFAAAKTDVLAAFSRAEQTLGMTMLRTCFSLGFVVGSGLAGLLLLVTEVPILVRCVAGSSLLLTLYSARLFAAFERRRSARTTETKKDDAQPAPGFSWMALIVPLAAVSLMQGSDRLRMIYLPLVTFEQFHDASLAPRMFGIAAAIELVTMVAAGALAARIGERWTVVLGALVGAAYFAVIALSDWLPALYAANVLWAMFIGALMGVAMAYLQHLVAHKPGVGSALFPVTMNAGALAGIFLPLLVTGYQPEIFWVGAALCVVGAGMLMVPAKSRG